ncbi:MAG: DUF2029 domain-containing protein [Deltaproteobacteria bacterium]|nr:DUF2029 domain-containing protein [Deltaproteobacteria bacterium]
MTFRSASITFVVLALALLQALNAFAASAPAVTGVRDFVEYWGASRLFLAGGNPYSPAELLAVEKAAGWASAEPLMMWNPPWTLSFIFPFGFLDFSSGQFAWLLAQMLCILVAGQILWRVYNPQTSVQPWRPWLLALTFVPIVFALILGQITPFILLGLTALLYFEREENWFAFGAALAILSIKPHLVFLFWIVLVLWLWQRKQWRVVLGAVAAGIGAAAIPLLFNAQIYSEYFALQRLEGITQPFDWPAPTLGNAVNFFFEFGGRELQLLPALVGIVWLLFYWRRHKRSWRWSERLPMILLVSVTTNFFVWTYDQVILLPALIQGASWLARRRLPWYRSGAALLYLGINLAHAVLRMFLADELWYFWLAPAMLIAYLVYDREAAALRATGANPMPGRS